MSAKKDAMVPMGGLLCIKDDRYLDVYTECRTLCVVQEGFPTYGGLEGGAMERLAVGLRDGMRQDWLAYRIGQVQYLADRLESIGVVCQQPGGHAAFVDAGKLLPHIPADNSRRKRLPGELYKVAGIRAVENWFISARARSENRQTIALPGGTLAPDHSARDLYPVAYGFHRGSLCACQSQCAKNQGADFHL